jgi:hypothetical protein
MMLNSFYNLQYDWLSAAIGHLSFEAEEVVACIPGIGAMPNCHFRLSNVRESFTRYDTYGLHRSKDPGAGAFSGYHGREGIAIMDLRAGSEIFVDYGEVSALFLGSSLFVLLNFLYT